MRAPHRMCFQSESSTHPSSPETDSLRTRTGDAPPRNRHFRKEPTCSWRTPPSRDTCECACVRACVCMCSVCVCVHVCLCICVVRLCVCLCVVCLPGHVPLSSYLSVSLPLSSPFALCLTHSRSLFLLLHSYLSVFLSFCPLLQSSASLFVPSFFSTHSFFVYLLCSVYGPSFFLLSLLSLSVYLVQMEKYLACLLLNSQAAPPVFQSPTRGRPRLALPPGSLHHPRSPLRVHGARGHLQDGPQRHAARTGGQRECALGDAPSFWVLTSKMTPLGSMLSFDADVKKTTARHQCENR